MLLAGVFKLDVTFPRTLHTCRCWTFKYMRDPWCNVVFSLVSFFIYITTYQNKDKYLIVKAKSVNEPSELILVPVAWSDQGYIYSTKDAMLVHHRVTLSINFTSTHLFSWVERGTVKVKCFPQQHNTRPRLEPRPFDPEKRALTTRRNCTKGKLEP